MDKTMDKTINSYKEDFLSPKPLFIGIAGIIGSGKTTVTQLLSDKLNLVPWFEPVKENPYLEKFYRDKKRYGFNMQIFLLNKRFRQHQHIIWRDESSVQDRTIYEDCIFAKMLYESGDIDPLDYQTYRELFQNMTNFLHNIDIIIYLDVEPEIAFERIKMRGRECEKDLPLEYLKALRTGYEEWLKEISQRMKVIRIDWNEFKDIDYIVNIINEN